VRRNQRPFPLSYTPGSIFFLASILLASIITACGGNRLAVIPQPTPPPIRSEPDGDPLDGSAAAAEDPAAVPPENGSERPDETAVSGNAANGEAIFNGTILVSGAAPCIACHQVSGTVAVVGPNLAGIAGQAENRIAGVSAADYLHESIVAPNSYIVEGFSTGIMSLNYADTLSEEQVADLVAYLLTLD
jgi:mono/diheme cytochrome c family protein